MAHLYRRDGKWYLRWKDGTGRWRHKKSDGRTKGDALELLAELERVSRRQRQGLEPLPSDCKLTLWELCQWWLTEHCPEPSREIANYQLAKHVKANKIGARTLSEINTGVLKGWLLRKAKALAPATHNKLRGYLSAAYECARDEVPPLWAGNNPVTLVRMRPVPRRQQDTLRRDELERLIACVSERWRDFVAVAIFTAMRKGELIGLKKADVDLRARSILVHRSYERDSTKGGVPMAIPISSDCLPYLQAAMCSPGPFVFPNSKGKMRSKESDPHKVIQRAADKAGIAKKLGTHALRHSYATIALSEGAPLPAISRMLRHKRISTTVDLYGHLQVDDLRALAELVSPQNPVVGMSPPKMLPAVKPSGSYPIRTDDPYRVKVIEAGPQFGNRSQVAATAGQVQSNEWLRLAWNLAVINVSCRCGVAALLGLIARRA